MTDSLYARLGGTDGIRTLVRTALELHIVNPTVSKRFEPLKRDPARFETALKHAVDFFAQGTGGPAAYQGKPMPEAHAGMNISGEEYLAVVDDIMAALQKHGADEGTQKDVLAIAYSLKPMIMRQ